MVSQGDWKDYAMDFLKERAVFSIYRRASEHALYRIEKRPKLKDKQGQFSVIAPGGLILKRGNDLKACLLYTSPSPRDGLLSRMPSSA